MPRNARLVRVRFSLRMTGNPPGYHRASIRQLVQYKRRCWEPFDSVDYVSLTNPRSRKLFGFDPDGRFIGKPLLQRGGKP